MTPDPGAIGEFAIGEFEDTTPSTVSIAAIVVANVVIQPGVQTA